MLQVIDCVGAAIQKCPLVFLYPKELLDTETYVKYLRENIYPLARANYGQMTKLEQIFATQGGYIV